MHMQGTTRRIDIFAVFNCAIMLLIVMVMLYPFYYVAIVSISDSMEVAKGRVHWLPVGLSFAAYEHIFSNEQFVRSFGNTLLYVTTGTLLNLFMSTLCAYPLSRKNFPLNRFFSLLIIFTMYFSGGMIPMYILINNLNMIDTIWAIILPGSISTYNMLVMRTFFANIPESLHEAAEIDGASEWRKIASVVLPLSMPIMATMTLFYAVDHWNSWFNAMIYLNSNDKYPLQLMVRSLVIEQNSGQYYSSVGMENESAVAATTIQYAGIIASTLPILIIYPVLQKYFVKGVMLGSIKG